MWFSAKSTARGLAAGRSYLSLGRDHRRHTFTFTGGGGEYGLGQVRVMVLSGLIDVLPEMRNEADAVVMYGRMQSRSRSFHHSSDHRRVDMPLQTEQRSSGQFDMHYSLRRRSNINERHL